MAIDLNAIRNRLNRLQNKTQKSDVIWKPSPGKQQIRIVPYVHCEENPFIELYFHYNFGGKTVISPKSFGEADPIAEFGNQLSGTGDKDDWQLARKLFPKMRTYVPIIVRGKEAEGVKFWGFGKTVYQELLAFFADPDYGDLTDKVNGRDITVEFRTAEELGKSYPETYIRVKPNTTPVSEDSNVLNLIDDQTNVSDLFKKYSYDEMKGMLEKWLETGDTSKESEEVPVESKQPTQLVSNNESAKSEKQVSNVKGVKDAFDSLFNDDDDLPF